MHKSLCKAISLIFLLQLGETVYRKVLPFLPLSSYCGRQVQIQICVVGSHKLRSSLLGRRLSRTNNHRLCFRRGERACVIFFVDIIPVFRQYLRPLPAKKNVNPMKIFCYIARCQLLLEFNCLNYDSKLFLLSSYRASHQHIILHILSIQYC